MEKISRNESEMENRVPWLERVRRTGEFSNVKVRIGSEEFNLHLLPLLSASPYFRRILSSQCFSFSELSGPFHVMEIPDFPGGQEAFSIAMDCCYGLATLDITVANLGKLSAAANLLEMEGLMKMTVIFVEENASSLDWMGCLRLLATVDDNGLYSGGSALFEAVQTLFLKKVTIPAHTTAFYSNSADTTESYSGYALFLNVTVLPSVVKLLPLSTARKILDCLVEKKFALLFKDDNSEGYSIRLVDGMYSEYSDCFDGSKTYSGKFTVRQWPAEEAINWLSQIESQGFERDSLILIHLSKLISGECSGHYRISRVVSGDFLCALLQATSILHSLYNSAEEDESDAGSLSMVRDLYNEIAAIKEIVGCNLDKLTAEVLQRLDFLTFRSVFEHFWMSYDTESDAGKVAAVVYPCIMKHLKENLMSEQNVMFLHTVFKKLLKNTSSYKENTWNIMKYMLKYCSITIRERQVVIQMINFDRLSGNEVDELFADSMLGYEPPLLKRLLDGNKKNVKTLGLLKEMQPSVQSRGKPVVRGCDRKSVESRGNPVWGCDQKSDANGESTYQEKCVDLMPQLLRDNELLLKRLSIVVRKMRTLCQNEGKPIPVFNDEDFDSD